MQSPIKAEVRSRACHIYENFGACVTMETCGSRPGSRWLVRLLPAAFCFLAFLLLAAAPPIAEYVPQGADGPLKTGDTFVLRGVRAHVGPSLAEASWLLAAGRASRVLITTAELPCRVRDFAQVKGAATSVAVGSHRSITDGSKPTTSEWVMAAQRATDEPTATKRTPRRGIGSALDARHDDRDPLVCMQPVGDGEDACQSGGSGGAHVVAGGSGEFVGTHDVGFGGHDGSTA